MSTCMKQALQENYNKLLLNRLHGCILLYVLCFIMALISNLCMYYNKLSYYSWYLLFKRKELI